MAVVASAVIIATSEAGAVVASTFTGLEVAGTVGGIVGTGIALITLWITISNSNHSKAQEYRREIAAAEKRGKDSTAEQIRDLTDERDQARKDRDWYRSQLQIYMRREPPPPPRQGEDE